MQKILTNSGFLAINLLLTFQISLMILYFMLLEKRFFEQFAVIRLHDMDFIFLQFGDTFQNYTEAIISQFGVAASYNLYASSNEQVIADKRPFKLKVNSNYADALEFISNFGYSDFHKLPLEIICEFDNKRSHLQYFLNYIYDYHIVSVSLFKFSYCLDT